MEFKTIILRKEEGVATLVFNRPQRRNAFNQDMLEELQLAMNDVQRDDAVRALVVTGREGAFSAGSDFNFSDIREGKASLPWPQASNKVVKELRRGRVLHDEAQFILSLQRLDKPTIAMVNGDAVGAGMDFALVCDIRFGSPRTRFMVAFTHLGLPEDSGGCWFLPRLVGIPKALELLYTGAFVEAEEALKIGLLNRLVPEDRLEEETMAFARKLAQGPAIAHRLNKMLLYKGLETDLELAIAHAMAAVHIALTSQDHNDALLAFAHKKAPVFHDR